jgi:hypothetical protein
MASGDQQPAPGEFRYLGSRRHASIFVLHFTGLTLKLDDKPLNKRPLTTDKRNGRFGIWMDGAAPQRTRRT